MADERPERPPRKSATPRPPAKKAAAKRPAKKAAAKRPAKKVSAKSVPAKRTASEAPKRSPAKRSIGSAPKAKPAAPRARKTPLPSAPEAPLAPETIESATHHVTPPASPEMRDPFSPPASPEARPAEPQAPAPFGSAPNPPGSPPPPSLPGAPGQFGWGSGPPLRPGLPALREMRVGEMIDAGITLFRSNFLPIAAIVAFVTIPISFLQQALLLPIADDPADSVSSGDVARIAIVTLLSAFSVLFLSAALTRATEQIYLGGKATVGDVYRFALRRVHSILWIDVLIVSPIIVAVVIGILVQTPAALIVLLPAALVVVVRLVLSTPAFVVERAKGSKAIARSWRLTGGFFWKTVGVLLTTLIITGVIGGIVEIPFAAGAAAIGDGGWWLAAIGSSISSIVIDPFSAIVIVLLYFDLRIRKEGFDLALMAQAMSERNPDA